MKKFLSLMLALAMVLSLAACGNNAETPTDSAEPSQSAAPSETGPAEFVPVTYEDEAVYMDALGEYYEILQKAGECTDVDEMYALQALAEGKLMESGVLQIWRGDGGGYSLTRIAPHTYPSVLWGSDSDRFETCVVTNEIIKVEDREALIDLWSEKKGTGEYEQAAKDYLTEQGYTFTDQLGYWDYASDPETWDILSAWTNTVGEPVCLTVEGLVKYDMENVLQPALAESWECSEDGLTWTFHIREGAVWTDAQGRKIADVTADDWVAALQHLFDWYGDSAAEVLTPLIENGQAYANGEITDFSQVGVKAVDDYTLEYHLTRVVPAFESTLTYCGMGAPLCRSYYESQGGTFGVDTHDNGTYGSSPNNIAYCGPYLITSYTALNSIIFEKNPSYWNADGMNVTKFTWSYNDGSDPLKNYDDFIAGNISYTGLGTSSLQKCKEDGNFEPYAKVTDLSGTTRIGFINLDRQTFALFNDLSACQSGQTHDSVDALDKDNGVYTSDILDDAARTHAAVNNQNFRLALSFGWDRASFNAQYAGEELKEVGLRNTYTPGSFVTLSKDVTVEVNGTATTFPAGTYYGAIAQAQIDADGYPITVWDPEANDGLGSGDGFDGYYNVDNAREYLAKAVEELAAQGVEITADDPIQLDYYYGGYAESFVNRAQAYKQSIEASLEGLVVVNLVSCADAQQLNATNFLNPTGAENCTDVAIGTGWTADYADPASYLNNLLPYGDGYQCKSIGLW